MRKVLFLPASLLVYACTSSNATVFPPGSEGGTSTGSSSFIGSSSSSTGAGSSAGASSGSELGSSDGGPGSTDGGPDGAGASSCSGLAFCDSFDNPAIDTVGGPPGLWTVAGEMGCSGQGPSMNLVTIDDTQSHSAPNSVKIMGPASYSCGPAMISASAFANVPSNSDVYGRFYIMLSSTSATFDHVAIMTLNFADNDDASVNFGTETSFLSLNSEGAGNATNVFMWQTGDSQILPDKNSAGGAQSTYPMADTWTCVEFHTSPSNDAIETWVGGAQAPVPGLTFPPSVAMVNNQWEAGVPTLPPFNFDSLGFGWVAYSAVEMTLWIDDVALSTTGRIGCN